MDGIRNKMEIEIDSKKLDWEAPKLISLDKRKTENGENTSFLEGTNYGTIS